MERNTRSRNDQQTPPVTLGTAVRRVMRQKNIVLLFVLIFAALGALAGSMFPERYEAKAVINVVQPSSGTSLRSALNAVDMDTEEAIAGSRTVLQAAADDLGMDVTDLKDSLNVAGHSNSTILDIVVTADTPEDAANAANTVAKAYLDHRKGTFQAGLDELRGKVDSVADDMTKQVVDEAVLSVVTTSTDSGSIISEAQPPQDSASFSMAQTIFIGAATGLLLGIFFAYVADRTARGLGYPQRLSEISGSQVSLMADGDERESAQHLLRRIGAPEGDLAKAGLGGITVYSPTPGVATSLAHTLQGVVAANTSFVDAAAFDTIAPSAMDAHIKQNSPVLVEADSTASVAQVMLAADSTGVLLLPFTDKSQRSSVSRLFNELTPSAGTQVIPVYYTSSTNL